MVIELGTFTHSDERIDSVAVPLLDAGCQSCVMDVSIIHKN